MDYFEMLEEIKRLIKNIINDKIKLLSNNIFLNNQDYYEYSIEIFNDLEIEHIILEKMVKYMNLIDEEDFYLSDEIELFEGIIKLFSDTSYIRRREIINSLYIYCYLISNDLLNTYTKPYPKSHIISKKTYHQLLDIIPKK